VFSIMTTNHIDKLDPALGVPTNGKSSRPGRMDRAIYMGTMAQDERRALAQLILADFPERIEQTVREGEGETPAQFQDRCALVATSLFWVQQSSSDHT
jgi:ATP-dependent 26S proteasome regulatory subunit